MLLIPFAAATLLATPAAAAGLTVSDAWVRLPAVSGRPAAAYFTLKAGDRAETVTGVSSPSATRAELHESGMSGGMMKMAPLKSIALTKGQVVPFQPGGRHVMLFGIDPKVKPGSLIRLGLRLANGQQIWVDARAVGTADGPPMQEHNH